MLGIYELEDLSDVGSFRTGFTDVTECSRYAMNDDVKMMSSHLFGCSGFLLGRKSKTAIEIKIFKLLLLLF